MKLNDVAPESRWPPVVAQRAGPMFDYAAVHV